MQGSGADQLRSVRWRCAARRTASFAKDVAGMTIPMRFYAITLSEASRKRSRRGHLPLQMFSLALSMLLLSGCSGISNGPTVTPDPSTPTSYPSEVDWETAVEILNTGMVESVLQLHNLDVTLMMKDGTEINTVEPRIDAIFQELEKCGEPCGHIILVTE